jgi:hypothetical protein
MAHPFFDVNAYPWQRADAGAFHEVLFRGIKATESITLIYAKCGSDLPPLTPARADLLWREVLDNLTGLGLLRVLIRIIESDGGAKLASDEYKKAVADVLNAEEAVGSRLLSDDVLVLDRDRLRELLRSLESDASLVRALLVRGSPKSGKSHGFHLFERVASERGALAVYIYEGMVGTVGEVVEQLFGALSGEPRFPFTFGA